MAITDNNFTPEEFEAAVTANPNLITDVLSKTSYISGLKDQHISGHVAEFAPRFEAEVETITGAKKEKDEKYYEYNKRILGSLVTEKSSLASELAELKKSSNITDAERQSLTAGQARVKELEKEIEDMKASHTKDISISKNENDIINEISSVTPKLIKDTRPGVAQAQKIVSDSILAEIKTMASRDSRGKIILLNTSNENKPLLNTDGSFITVSAYYESKMKEAGFIDTGKKLPGAGGDPDLDTKNIPGGCKTRLELMDFIRKANPKWSTTECSKEFDKHAGLLPNTNK